MAIIDSFLQRKTDWRFAGSQSGGLCVNPKKVVVSICGGGGSYFVSDGSGKEHQLSYLMAEVGIGLFVSWLVSVFGSTRTFPSTGLGSIYAGPLSRGPLSFKDLKGNMLVVTFSKGTIGATGEVSFVFMGVPWWITLVGQSHLDMLGARAVGIVAGLTARLEISVASASAARGRIL